MLSHIYLALEDYVGFFKKLANCLPKWLYHFVFPLTINEAPIASHSCQHSVLSVFWIFSSLAVCNCISFFPPINSETYLFILGEEHRIQVPDVTETTRQRGAGCDGGRAVAISV